MKVKLVDVLENPTEEQTGTCEYCFSTIECDNPVFVFQLSNGKEVLVDGYWWDYDNYDEVYISNIINFASWLDDKDFPDDTVIDTDWLVDMADKYSRKYTGYQDAYGREIKVGDVLCVSLSYRELGEKLVFKAPVECWGSFGWRSHGVTWKQKHIEFELDKLINYRDYLDDKDKSPDDIIWTQVTIDEPAPYQAK